MRFAIDSDVIAKDNITIQEFSVLLYYIAGGVGILNESLCSSLWNKGFLVKDVEGYILDNNKISLIESWTAQSSITPSTNSRLESLASKLRDLYPSGKKAGTNYYWKDSVALISQRLAMFFKKFGNGFTDEQLIQATKGYVESFNGNYQYMQLLKYFIYKRGVEKGEETSQLLSYMENNGQVDANDSWMDNVR